MVPIGLAINKNESVLSPNIRTCNRKIRNSTKHFSLKQHKAWQKFW
jgi:hypothetical protein